MHNALRRQDCTVLHSWRMAYIIWKIEISSFEFIKTILIQMQIFK